MAVGDVTGPEGKTFQDHRTKTTIHQLTSYRCHNHHPYFTNRGLWDGGLRLLIDSHRYNASNFFSIELATGELTQLTDFDPAGGEGTGSAFLSPVRDEAYFCCGREVRALELPTGVQRTLWETPEGMRRGNLSCTADGKTVCLRLMEDMRSKIHMDLKHGYVGMEAQWAAHPHCQIVAIPTDGGAPRVLHEDNYWLGHVNTSPTLPEMLTFCHEGPWMKVEQRIWTLNVATGEVRPLREQVPGERIGHEYWFTDGERIGYHGRNVDGVEIFGLTRWDDTGRREFDFPYGSYHFHSMDETLIVGDGMPDTPQLLLWRLRDDGTYDGPRRLLTHRGSFHSQFVHPHPHMFRDVDGKVKVVYTADPRGYGHVFIAEVGEFESLPMQE